MAEREAADDEAGGAGQGPAGEAGHDGGGRHLLAARDLDISYSSIGPQEQLAGHEGSIKDVHDSPSEHPRFPPHCTPRSRHTRPTSRPRPNHTPSPLCDPLPPPMLSNPPPLPPPRPNPSAPPAPPTA